MGWCTGENEDAGHEGYIVGIVLNYIVVINDSRAHALHPRWRELGYPKDQQSVPDVSVVQVGCDCGWRSERMHAPFGTSYAPYVVLVENEAFEEECRKIWLAHVVDCRARRVRVVG